MMTRTARRLCAVAGIAAALSVTAWLVGGPGVDAAVAANAAPAAARPQATTYSIDPVHTSVVFGIEWGGMSPFYGQFNDYRGTVAYDGSTAESFRCEISIPVESIDSHNEQRDRHLKSPDFFNAREFADITFKSTRLTDNGDGTWTLAGELSMHGQTKPVEAKVTHLATRQTQQGNRCGLGAELVVKRTDFGIGPQQGLGDEVRLMIGVQSVAR